MSTKNNNLKSSEIIGRVGKSIGSDENQLIAKALGVKPQVCTNWKTRNTIPWKQLLIFSEKTKTSFNWLLTGKESEKDMGGEPGWTISPEARDRYKYLIFLISEINEAAKKEYSGIELGEILIETIRISIKKIEFEKKSKKKEPAANSA